MGPKFSSPLCSCLLNALCSSTKTACFWAALLALILASGTQIGWALPAPTTTTLTLTSGGAPVTTLVRGNVITLTATVTAGGSPVTPGQVDFCDASVSYCTDIRLLGTVQLSKSGVAKLKFQPGNGTHRYRAVFRGTNSYAPSSSASLPLVVAGTNASATQISSSGSIGNYTLSATVSGAGDTSPTGSVSFLNTTSGNAVLGSATLEGNPSSWTFLNSSIIPVAYSAAVGDFNGDGLPDVVSVKPYSCQHQCVDAEVIAALGDGRGGFTAAPPLDLGITQGRIIPLVADFDADGNSDLVETDGSSITVLAGNGDGTFSFKAPSSVGSQFTSLTIADFNRDGLPDLALVTSNFVLIYRGNGDGTFSASPAAPTPYNAGYYPFVAAGDFNGDGIPDLAIVGGSDALTVFLGNGDETFKAAQNVVTPPGSLGGQSYLVVADFNEDGKADLAALNPWSLTILLGNGDGSFSPTAQSPLSLVDSYHELTAMAFGDFNGSGHVGLAFQITPGMAEYGIDAISGNGDGTLGPGRAWVQGYGSLVPVLVADFNGDGQSDVAASSLSLSFAQSSIATVTGISVPVATGSDQVVASFPGDSNYMPSASAPTTLNAAQGTPTIALSASPNPAPYGSAVTLTATVSGSGLTPTGTVQLLDGSAILGTTTLDSSGTATYVAKSLEMRTHSISATYGGDSNYTSATPALLTLTVTKPVPTVSVTSSTSFLPLGASATFTATFTGSNTTPTGTVSFLDGSTQLAQVALNSSGVASYSTASLAEGTHTIVAAYGGDSSYAPVTSSSVQVVTSSKPFLTVTGIAVAVSAGATSGNTSTITITPQQGFVGTVALAVAVSAGPAGGQYPPTVSLVPSSATITGTSAATAMLTVNTTAPHQAQLSVPKKSDTRWYGGAAGVLACLLLFGIPARCRILKRTLGCLGLFIVLSAGVLSCGGGGNHDNNATAVAGTTPGAYTITVTATSGPITQPGSVALTVQ